MALTQTTNIDAVGNTIVTGPLTDTQLRATAIPISGALTDTQIRASPLPVSAATSATGTITSVLGVVISGVILAANANRRGFTIYNDSTSICRVALAATASAAAFTVLLQPNSFYENNTLYTGVISGIWASAVGSARVTELT